MQILDPISYQIARFRGQLHVHAVLKVSIAVERDSVHTESMSSPDNPTCNLLSDNSTHLVTTALIK